mmetsp:Transcript_13258/g.20833  ORF Transcript_13258/g.20833 Transcript_13258/m.20833 type:complete len:95 (-) Transcript_13258:536-820(-)
MSLIDQQMKFLQSQRGKAPAEEAKESKPVEATAKPEPVETKEEEKEVLVKVEDVWFYLEGKGQMGMYTSLWHKPTGAAVELWHGDSTPSFASFV